MTINNIVIYIYMIYTCDLDATLGKLHHFVGEQKSWRSAEAVVTPQRSSASSATFSKRQGTGARKTSLGSQAEARAAMAWRYRKTHREKQGKNPWKILGKSMKILGKAIMYDIICSVYGICPTDGALGV